MAMKSLNQLRQLRRLVIGTKWLYLRYVWGMDIHRTAEFSWSTRFDKTYPKGIHVGPETYIAFDAAILSHDTTRRLYRDTIIGRRCFIGARSIVMAGVKIGDECIIGSGSVVTKDVPPRSIAAGNPARVLRSNDGLDPYGRFPKHSAPL